MLTLDIMDKFLSMGLPEGSTKDGPITCPMGEELQGVELPPYLLCVAEEDLVIDTEMEFYEGMKKDGKKIELLVSEGVGHNFYLNKIAIDIDPITSQLGVAKWVGWVGLGNGLGWAWVRMGLG
ncbi:putative carboxylesterase [Helianthus annuus]|nr:putative carboxylesterase [Helianthus annuus]